MGALLELSVIAEHLQHDQCAELKTIFKRSGSFHHTGPYPFPTSEIRVYFRGFNDCLKHYLNQDLTDLTDYTDFKSVPVDNLD